MRNWDSGTSQPRVTQRDLGLEWESLCHPGPIRQAQEWHRTQMGSMERPWEGKGVWLHFQGDSGIPSLQHFFFLFQVQSVISVQKAPKTETLWNFLSFPSSFFFSIAQKNYQDKSFPYGSDYDWFPNSTSPFPLQVATFLHVLNGHKQKGSREFLVQAELGSWGLALELITRCLVIIWSNRGPVHHSSLFSFCKEQFSMPKVLLPLFWSDLGMPGAQTLPCASWIPSPSPSTDTCCPGDFC